MNLKELKELIELVQQSQLTELELEKSGVRVRIRKENPAPPPQVTMVPHAVPAGVPQTITEATPGKVAQESSPLSREEESDFVFLNSPVVGTFYRSPAPEAEPYADQGDIVKKGQILCIIEAMKLMNEIEAECDGKVVEILVENAQAVEFGEPLFKIDPKSDT